MEQAQQVAWKKAAAEAAAALVEDGMILGLGTGSTASFFLAALARRMAEQKLRCAGIPTSEGTALQARRHQDSALHGSRERYPNGS